MRSAILKLYRFLFAHSWAAKLNYLLFDCATRGLGILNYESRRVSGEAYLMRDLLPHLVSTTPVMFDVGANVGRYSDDFLLIYPRAKVHAFEPNPRAYARLVTLIGDRGLCVNEGLSDSPGKLTLYDRADDEGSEHASLYRDVISGIHKANVSPATVSLGTLDDYCAAHQIERIDLLKIDTEGHELKVLQGAKRMLAANQIGVVQIEFNEMNIMSRCFFHDFVELLPNHSLFRLLPGGLLTIRTTPLNQELFAFQNLVALPKRAVAATC